MCFYKFHDRLLDYNVSPRAMILYAILADRMQLSKKNDNFKDKDGVFIYFTLEKIQEVLHVAYNTAKNLMKELASNHLIRKKRQGQGQPNKIYVYEFEESESQTEQTDKKTSHKTDKKTSHKTDKKTSHKTDKK
ncbi:MAG: replication initiator protein A, partial [Clostridia bacterium]|nr:replication initiator protein A [Clostridia bacterium]